MRSSRQFSFLNGPNKLVFVRMYRSTFTGLVEPPYLYYSLVAFFAFLCVLCFLCFFMLYCTHKNTHKQKLTNENKLILNNAGNNFLLLQTFKRIKVTYFALVYINI